MRTQCQRNEAILPLWWWRSVGGESYQRHPRHFSFVRWLSIYFRSLLFIQFFHCVQRRYPMLRSTTFDGRQKKFSGGQHMLSHVIYTRTHVELMECTGAHIFTSYQSVMEWAEEICQEENSLPSANMMRIFDIAISFWNLVDVCVGSGTTTVRRSQCILPHLGYWQHAVAVKCVSQLQPAPRRIFFILLRVSFANAIWLLARQKAIMKV